MSLSKLLQTNHNDLSDHDLAHLADWATTWKELTPNSAWKRAYALIREGADLLLRRRAMSHCTGTESVAPENHIGAPTGIEPETPDPSAPTQ